MISILVDADSLPVPIRQVILRRCMKEQLRAIFVADRLLKDVELAYQEHTAFLRAQARAGGVTDEAALKSLRSGIEMVVVPSGDDSADDHLVAISAGSALAITHDIPLADRLVERGLVVLDDRGGIYTAENIGERLSLRNAMEELRLQGVHVEQQGRMDSRQVKAFSDAFDRELTKILKQE